MLYRAILFALVFFSCAALPFKPVPLRLMVSVNTSELSPIQRKAVQEAEESWVRQTRGCVQFTEGQDTRIIHMVPPEKYDTDNQYVIGLCQPEVGNCQTIEIAFTRTYSFDFAVIVIAHELGHAIGLRHVCGDGFSSACETTDHSLMRAGITHAWINLSNKDRAELERATGCTLDGN